MKPKRRRKLRKTKSSRGRREKIIATAAKRDLNKAWTLATFGPDGEAVSKKMISNPYDPSMTVRPRGGLHRFIQDWLFAEAWRTDPFLRKHITPEEMQGKIDELNEETGLLFGYMIATRDYDFFEQFGKRLRAEAEFRDAATFKHRDSIRAEILEAIALGKPVDLPKMADEAVSKEYPLDKKPSERVKIKLWEARRRDKRKNIYRNLARVFKTLKGGTLKPS